MSTKLPLSQVWHIVGVSYRWRTSLSKVTPGDHATTGATTIFLLPRQHAQGPSKHAQIMWEGHRGLVGAASTSVLHMLPAPFP